MSKRKRRYIPNPNPFTASLFGQYSHRWPEASYSLAYAMACVEVVANANEEAGEVYREIVAAWGAPGFKKLVEDLTAGAPSADIEEWKQELRHPELAFLPDPNKPLRDAAALFSGELVNKEFTEDEQRSLAEKFLNDPQFAGAAGLYGLMCIFIVGGFNRDEDLEKDVWRVNPLVNPSWVVFALTLRTALEHVGATLEVLQAFYNVGQRNGKPVNYVDVMTKQPTSRIHREVVDASQKLTMKLRHDSIFMEAAWLWYQSRVVHKGVMDYWKNLPPDDTLDLKYLQKKVKLCDDAVGYQARVNNVTA